MSYCELWVRFKLRRVFNSQNLNQLTSRADVDERHGSRSDAGSVTTRACVSDVGTNVRYHQRYASRANRDIHIFNKESKRVII